MTAQSGHIIAAVEEALRGLPLIFGYHNISVVQTDGRFDVSIHCTFNPSISIRDVHHVSELVSQRVREAVPTVNRVIVHPEP